jgi:hypothetical protein
LRRVLDFISCQIIEVYDHFTFVNAVNEQTTNNGKVDVGFETLFSQHPTLSEVVFGRSLVPSGLTSLTKLNEPLTFATALGLNAINCACAYCGKRNIASKGTFVMSNVVRFEAKNTRIPADQAGIVQRPSSGAAEQLYRLSAELSSLGRELDRFCRDMHDAVAHVTMPDESLLESQIFVMSQVAKLGETLVPALHRLTRVSNHHR